VRAKLRQRWSLEQIAGRLKRDHRHDPAMHVTPETIYAGSTAGLMRVNTGTSSCVEVLNT